MKGRERCDECGSWEAECSSEVPVLDCACARCLRAAVERAERERDEETRKRYAAEAERDALKAALRELADMAQGLDVSFFDHEEAMLAEAVLQRAREALGEES